MTMDFEGHTPELGEYTFVADNAAVVGEVSIGADSSVWFGASIRGDFDYIRIGERTNVQDNVTIHNDFDRPVNIGNDVSLGHNCVIHSCTVGDGCLIGMGAVVLDFADIGEGSIVGAGAVVTKGTVIPPRSLVMGIPAKVVRPLTEAETEGNLRNAKEYVIRKDMYLSQIQTFS